MNRLSVLFALVLVCGYAFAQTPTLKELEEQGKRQKQVEAFDDVLKKLDELKTQVNKEAQAFTLACMKSFGAKAFCDCISSSRPVVFSFVDYVLITSRSKEENGFETMASGDQKAYESVGRARDKCVARLTTK